MLLLVGIYQPVARGELLRVLGPKLGTDEVNKLFVALAGQRLLILTSEDTLVLTWKGLRITRRKELRLRRDTNRFMHLWEVARGTERGAAGR